MNNSDNNTIYVEVNIINIYAKFQFRPLLPSEKRIFEYLFRKFSLSVTMATKKNSDLDKIQVVGRGLLHEHFRKTFVKISAVK